MKDEPAHLEPPGAPHAPPAPSADEPAPRPLGNAAPPDRTRLRVAHPFVVGAALAALWGALGRTFHAEPDVTPVAAPAAAASYDVPCPAGSIADFGLTPPTRRTAEARAVCVPVPHERDTTAAHTAETLPRRADRPEDFAEYVLPLDAEPLGTAVLAPASLSDGSTLRVPQARQKAVRALHLDGQSEPTRIVFAGERDGLRIVTMHTVPRERGTVRVLLVHDGLGSIDPKWTGDHVAAPLPIEPGTELGKTGDQGLTLSAKQLRRDVALEDVFPDFPPTAVLSTDLRNVLPLRAPSSSPP